MVPQTLLLNSFIYEFEGRRTQLDPEVLIVPILLNNLAGSRNLQINYTTHILRYASSPGLGTFCTFFFFFGKLQDKISKMSDVVFISQRRKMNVGMAYCIPRSLSNRKMQDPTQATVVLG